MPNIKLKRWRAYADTDNFNSDFGMLFSSTDFSTSKNVYACAANQLSSI
jgi:hypothetical protein